MADEKRLRIHPDLVERARQFRRPMTPMEMKLWSQIRDRRCGGYKFRRQVVIDRFIVDFLCVEVNLIVEIDGESHVATIERDAFRDEWLALHGYHTLRISNEEVKKELDSVLSRIEERCKELIAVQNSED